jgi:5-methyltetrahydropteroyltriglutamate--homocysteine methyltransferase
VKRSIDRIIVSHAGTLPRPAPLQKLFLEGSDAQAEFEKQLPGAVRELVKKQAELGIDVVNDGEISKRGAFIGYIRERMTGIEFRNDLQISDRDAGVSGREVREFPEYYKDGLGGFNIGGPLPWGGAAQHPFVVSGPLTYVGQDIVEADIARLKAACEGLDVEPYLPAVSPGTIEHWLWRAGPYKTDEEFLFALGDVMHEEYKAITDAGVVLQIDDPDLPDAWQMYPDQTLEEYRKYAALRVEALNHALRDVPEDRVRFHTCWGSFHNPHRNDIPLKDIVDLIVSVKAECYSIEAANARHEHEWAVWAEAGLPEGKSLMPGVVGHATDGVEHPDLVAQRLIRYAEVVGKENVIAGTDCGLGGRVHPEVVWAKLEDLARGAALASERLW